KERIFGDKNAASASFFLILACILKLLAVVVEEVVGGITVASKQRHSTKPIARCHRIGAVKRRVAVGCDRSGVAPRETGSHGGCTLSGPRWCGLVVTRELPSERLHPCRVDRGDIACPET